MTDIVYVLGTGSQHGNKELYYSLRSVERYLTGYRDIYIIGEPPNIDTSFLSSRLIHIECKDHGFNIQDNIRRKIEIACNRSEISDTFFFTNDDHIFLQPLNVNELPYYYSGDLELANRRKRKKGSYKVALQNTQDELEKRFYATYNFDIHVPILYNKKLFLKVMELYPWKTTKWGMVIKSLYCNTLMVKPMEYPDMQIGWQCETKEQIINTIKDRFVFAFNDEGANSVMFDFLKEMFT